MMVVESSRILILNRQDSSIILGTVLLRETKVKYYDSIVTDKFKSQGKDITSKSAVSLVDRRLYEIRNRKGIQDCGLGQR